MNRYLVVLAENDKDTANISSIELIASSPRLAVVRARMPWLVRGVETTLIGCEQISAELTGDEANEKVAAMVADYNETHDGDDEESNDDNR